MALDTNKAAKLEGRMTRIARTFARNRNLRVVLSGVRCDTDASGTIRLPANADYLDDNTQDALEGMLDHEWAHQAEETEHREQSIPTPLDLMKSLKSNRERMMFNVYEDIRIETKYASKFIGVAQNLESNNKLAYNNIRKRLLKDGAKADRWWLFGCGLIARAHGIETGWLPAASNEMLDRISDLIARSRKTATGSDSKALAVETLARIKEMAEEPEPKPEPKPKREEHKDSKPTTKPEEREDEGDANEGDKSEGENGSEEQDGEGSGSGEQDEDGEEQEGESKSGAEGEEQDGEQDEGAEGSGSSAEQDGEDTKDEAGGKSEGSSGDEGEASGSQGEGEDDSSEDTGSEAAPGDAPSDECRKMAEGMADRDCEGSDVMEATKDAIEKAARQDVAENQRHIPHPAAQAKDKVRVVKTTPLDAAEYQKLLDAVRPQVGALRSKILTVLRSLKVRRMVGDKEGGSIDEAALYSLRTGNKRIFAERTAEVELNTVVGILIDQSGSMNSKLAQTRAAVIALAECLSQVGIPFAIWGFSNREGIAVVAPEEHKLYNRFESNDIDVFKDFNETFRATRTRLTHIRAGGNNVDHEFVEWAARQMAARKEARKVLIVMSDGEPAAWSNMPLLQKSLKETVARVINAGIEVFGLGILDKAVQRFYPDWAVVKDIDQLAPVMFKMLRDYMLKGKGGGHRSTSVAK